MDLAFRYSLLICSLSGLAVMGLFFYELTSRSKLSIARFGFGFFVGSSWDPVAGDFGACLGRRMAGGPAPLRLMGTVTLVPVDKP